MSSPHPHPNPQPGSSGTSWKQGAVRLLSFWFLLFNACTDLIPGFHQRSKLCTLLSGCILTLFSSFLFASLTPPSPYQWFILNSHSWQIFPLLVYTCSAAISWPIRIFMAFSSLDSKVLFLSPNIYKCIYIYTYICINQACFPFQLFLSIISANIQDWFTRIVSDCIRIHQICTSPRNVYMRKETLFFKVENLYSMQNTWGKWGKKMTSKSKSLLLITCQNIVP